MRVQITKVLLSDCDGVEIAHEFSTTGISLLLCMYFVVVCPIVRALPIIMTNGPLIGPHPMCGDYLNYHHVWCVGKQGILKTTGYLGLILLVAAAEAC